MAVDEMRRAKLLGPVEESFHACRAKGTGTRPATY